MKSYLSTMNEREKWMVIAAALCVFLYVYYLFLYSPLKNNVSSKSTQLVEKIQTLEWMKKVRTQAKSSQNKQNLDNGQLLTLVATQLKENHTLKFPYQLQQTGAGDVQLTFDAVPFQLFLGWLAKLNEKYAFKIKQFDIEHTEKPGITKLMVVLSAG